MSSEGAWRGCSLWSTADSGFKCFSVLDSLVMMANSQRVWVLLVRPNYGSGMKSALSGKIPARLSPHRALCVVGCFLTLIQKS